MKYARRSAATTSTETTTEVTKTAVFFLDELILLSHTPVSESYLKYMRQQGQSLVWGSKLFLAGHLFKNHRNRCDPKLTTTVMGLPKKNYSNGKKKHQEENQNLKISDPVLIVHRESPLRWLPDTFLYKVEKNW